jgi:predicted ATP-dependent Lon-type protease
MSRDDLRDRVGDMIAALQRAREFTGGMTLAEFAKFQTGFYADPADAVFKALGVE